MDEFTHTPSDQDPEDYDVKLVFKPVQDTVCDRNSMDGVQEFTVKGTLVGNPCDNKEGVQSDEVRSNVGCMCMCVCVCVCVCVRECVCVCM